MFAGAGNSAPDGRKRRDFQPTIAPPSNRAAAQTENGTCNPQVPFVKSKWTGNAQPQRYFALFLAYTNQ